MAVRLLHQLITVLVAGKGGREVGGVCKITLLQPLVQAVFNYSFFFFFLEFDLVKRRSGSRFLNRRGHFSAYCQNYLANA